MQGSRLPASALPAAVRARLVLLIALAAGVCVACVSLAPPARLAERTALLLPAFFVQSPVDPASWGAPPVQHSEVNLGPAYPGAVLHIYRQRGGRRPALIVSLGVQPAPPDDPRVVRLLQGLASQGIVAVLVQSPALDAGSLQADAPGLLVAAFHVLAAQPFTDPGRIGLVGLSVGGSLALIAAADPSISGRVRLVEAFGAYGSLASLARSVLTRTVEVDGVTEPWQPDGAITTPVVRHNLIDWLAPPGEQAALEADFRAATPPPEARATLSPAGRAVFDLLTATDGVRFDALYRALPAASRAALAALSPETSLGRIQAPVYLMADKGDSLVPYAESRHIAAGLTAAGHPPYFSQFDIFRHVDPTRGGSPRIVSRDLLRLFLHVAAILGQL